MPTLTFNSRSKWPLFIVLLLAVIGAGVIYYSTALGSWANDDSIDYFAVARNFAAGNGLVVSRPSGRLVPLYLQPPFYPLVLSLAAFADLDLLQSARWLGIGLFASIIFLLGLGTLQVTRSPRLAILSAACLMVNTAMINNYAGAMTEGLFFILGFAGIFSFFYYLHKPRLWIVLASGLFAGLAFLTRFSGVAFIATGVFGILVLGKQSIIKRLSHTLIYLLPAGLPYLVWTLFIRRTYPNIKPENINWHVDNVWQVTIPLRGYLTDSVWSWLGLNFIWEDPPHRLKLVGLGLIFLLVLALTLFFVLRFVKQHPQDSLTHQPVLQLGLLWLVFFLVSAFILIFSYIYRVPKPDLFERIFSPIQTGLLLSGLALFEWIGQAGPARRFVLALPWVVGIWFIGINLPGSFTAAQTLHQEGLGYTSRAWVTSPTIQMVRNLPADTPLISNQPGAIYFITGRPTYDMISSLWDSGMNEPGILYGDNGNDPNQVRFRDEQAALVVFDYGMPSQLQAGSEENTRTLWDLTHGLFEYAHLEDGQIFFYTTP
jgi:succinate dehydrogenase hydrophobic anchor subunit